MAQLKDLIVTGTARILGKLYASEIVGKLTGNADTATSATKLSTARNVQTNLGSTSSASFDGTANITPGVTGTLPISNGGTGQTTTNAAANSFINSLETGSSTPTDADYYVSQYVGGGTTTTTYHRRPMSALWNYIKSKLATVATSGSYNDLSNKPTIPTVGNGTITITQNGTTKGTFTTNQSGNTTIELTDNNTTYSVATSSALGLVKSGTDITVDSSGNVSVNDDSHNHVISNVDGLQSALDGKASSSHTHNYAGSSSAGGSATSAVSVVDYADSSKTIKIGFAGAGATTSNLAYIAGYLSGGTQIKDVSKDTLKSWLGLGSAAYTNSDAYAASSHTHSYAGSSSAGGSANSAVKLDSSAGSATQPVYFSGGKPVACTYTLEKSVPSDAKFTDTTYSTGTASASGLTKLYTGTGANTDGTMTQYAITEQLRYKLDCDSAVVGISLDSGGEIMLSTNNGDKQIITSDDIAVSASLTSGTKVGTITINGTATDLYCQTNTDTHYTSHLYVGASGGNANATTATSNPYLLCVDNTTNRNSVQLKAGSNMSISAVNGVVTFSAANTTYGTGNASTSGLTKLYTGTGTAVDGTMTQAAITNAISAMVEVGSDITV